MCVCVFITSKPIGPRPLKNPTKKRGCRSGPWSSIVRTNWALKGLRTTTVPRLSVASIRHRSISPLMTPGYAVGTKLQPEIPNRYKTIYNYCCPWVLQHLLSRFITYIQWGLLESAKYCAEEQAQASFQPLRTYTRPSVYHRCRRNSNTTSQALGNLGRRSVYCVGRVPAYLYTLNMVTLKGGGSVRQTS